MKQDKIIIIEILAVLMLLLFVVVFLIFNGNTDGKVYRKVIDCIGWEEVGRCQGLREENCSSVARHYNTVLDCRDEYLKGFCSVRDC